MATMKPSHERFVQAYAISSNATQAYLIAFPHITNKNSANKLGSDLLANVGVKARLAEITKKSSRKTQITQELVLTNLKSISDRCLQIEPVMVKDGKETVQEQAQYICSKCDEVHTVGLYKFDAAGANKANELLGRYMAMFTDKIEHSGGVTFEDYMIQRKKRKLAAAKRGDHL